jgi:hypothetical protein
LSASPDRAAVDAAVDCSAAPAPAAMAAKKSEPAMTSRIET